MRQGNHNKQRMRGRGRKSVSPATRTYDSNGPDVKVRGNAHHIAEKYQQLARDAQAAGDRIMAENFLQHAEHYTRIIASAQSNSPSNPRFNVESMGNGTEQLPETGAEGAEIVVSDTQVRTNSEVSGINSERMNNGSGESVLTETVQENLVESSEEEPVFPESGFRPNHRTPTHRSRSGGVRRSAMSRSRSGTAMRSSAKN